MSPRRQDKMERVKIFGDKIKAVELDEYCQYYGLDKEETTNQLRQRGYHISQI